MGEYKKYWWGLIAVLVVTFTFLGWQRQGHSPRCERQE